jgi:serine/threonine protein kinase
MNPTLDETGGDDPRLLQAVKEYLADLEAGRRPDRHAITARYPELRSAMVPYLDALDAVHAVSPALHSRSSNRPAPPAETSIPAEPLGDFSIVREIGRGGMGMVYEAIQLSLGRRVALKVLPFAATMDPRQLQRFHNEARAAASLHHPNIVPVYAVGAERGVHFYAMQLIEGQNLAALIEDLRRVDGAGESNGSRTQASLPPTGPYVATIRAGSPPVGARSPDPAPPDDATHPSLAAELSTHRTEHSAGYYRTIARLIAQAAAGLEYAHGLGIVHRDVKPANLLLDGRGNVWVTDFGLATFHADASLTQTGDMLGTLRYMSPEQAGGRRALLDHRTDVYSLGATLYELLTLRPIFDAADRQALLQQILHAEPRPPRSIDRSIPPELETIVLKALGKTPAERYATAQEFADDLKRFLEDRPIQARRPTLLEKATKWSRRHKAVVVSGLLALLVSIAALSVAYHRERQKAREAEESFRQARQAVDEFTKISVEELAGYPFLEGPRRRLLQAALAYYNDFIDQHRDDPSIYHELEVSRGKVEAILEELTTLMGAGQYGILYVEKVQDLLGLSDDERNMLRGIENEGRRAFSEAFRSGPEAGERRRVEFARKQEAEVKQLLKPEQFRRFKQLALQNQGPAAFRELEVIAELKLTEVQQKRIRSIEASNFYFIAGPGPRIHLGGPRDDPQRKPPPDPRSAAMEQIQKELTEEQGKRWQAMIGERVDLSIFRPSRLPRQLQQH